MWPWIYAAVGALAVEALYRLARARWRRHR